MQLARTVYTRELKIAAMRALDAGETGAQVARRMHLSPKMLERWRAEWRAQGEWAFPGVGRRSQLALNDASRKIMELERKIGQMTIENDLLKKVLAQLKSQPRRDATAPPPLDSTAPGSTSKSPKRRKREDA